MRDVVHYGIHFIGPLIMALLFFRANFWKAYGLMLLGICIDLDHLLATPMFDANRCSINFHPLHSYYAMAIYLMLCIPKATRIIGLGLVIHILADSTDCLLM